MTVNKENIVESILFVAGDMVNIKDIAAAIEADLTETKRILTSLSDSYIKDKRGIRIIEVENCFQMTTNPEYFPYINKLYEKPIQKNLSNSALETLAIIAYKQPITKGEIDEIRGVVSNHIVNKLIDYELVVEIGRSDKPGKPLLFGTTELFFKRFGMKDINDLPNLVLDKQKLEWEAKKEIENLSFL